MMLNLPIDITGISGTGALNHSEVFFELGADVNLIKHEDVERSTTQVNVNREIIACCDAPETVITRSQVESTAISHYQVAVWPGREEGLRRTFRRHSLRITYYYIFIIVRIETGEICLTGQFDICFEYAPVSYLIFILKIQIVLVTKNNPILYVNQVAQINTTHGPRPNIPWQPILRSIYFYKVPEINT